MKFMTTKTYIGRSQLCKLSVTASVIGSPSKESPAPVRAEGEGTRADGRVGEWVLRRGPAIAMEPSGRRPGVTRAGLGACFSGSGGVELHHGSV